MCKTLNRALTISLAGMLLCGISLAQQSSAPPTNPPAASTTPPATPKTQASTTEKSGTTAAKKTPAPLVLKTEKDKASYAIGMNIGKGLAENMKKDQVEVNNDILLRGLKDALAGNKSLLTDEQIQAALTTLQNDLRKHQQELHDAEVAKNSSAGTAFLAANKAKPGVVTLPSGLQYKIITEGNGPKPPANDVVICNYKGTLIDGTEFDSSYKRGKPASIPVGRVIKGWTEALEMMPVGSKWQLYIPPTLGYGEAGTNGGPIGPDATLIFEVELLSIQPKGEAKPAPAPGTAPEAQPKAQPEAAPEAKPQ
ncbi:MAG: FKBP-type peptidyl-prolyl cis-trans isomerase [Candidatus Acidiferrum sp.]